MFGQEFSTFLVFLLVKVCRNSAKRIKFESSQHHILKHYFLTGPQIFLCFRPMLFWTFSEPGLSRRCELALSLIKITLEWINSLFATITLKNKIYPCQYSNTRLNTNIMKTRIQVLKYSCPILVTLRE